MPIYKLYHAWSELLALPEFDVVGELIKVAKKGILVN